MELDFVLKDIMKRHTDLYVLKMSNFNKTFLISCDPSRVGIEGLTHYFANFTKKLNEIFEHICHKFLKMSNI